MTSPSITGVALLDTGPRPGWAPESYSMALCGSGIRVAAVQHLATRTKPESDASWSTLRAMLAAAVTIGIDEEAP